MKQLLVLIALLLSLQCAAQSRIFAGRVTDKEKRGIPYAVVAIKDRNEGVYTDENGRFAFTANADEVRAVVVSCIGYEPQEVSAELVPVNDSMMITLKPKAVTMKAISVTGKKGKVREDILGRSRKHLPHDGECYRYYGAETAIKLAADTGHGGTLKHIFVYITGEGAFDTRFRVHVYRWGALPGEELTDSNLVVQAKKGNSWVDVDVSRMMIPVDSGLYVSVEWISGFGNTLIPQVSQKTPEVSYNGQVPGITAGYGKPSRTYSRQPFSKEWIYYDSADAKRKGGYFLNPMIYCTYTYVD
jgi:hypothetical protein